MAAVVEMMVDDQANGRGGKTELHRCEVECIKLSSPSVMLWTERTARALCMHLSMVLYHALVMRAGGALRACEFISL